MKAKTFKRVLALALATAMVLTACGQKPAANTSESTQTSESSPAKESEAASGTENKEDEPKEVKRITMFPANASLFSGLVTGYRGEQLASHGIELEVWAYSDEKYNAMLTSGDFPDMMYVGPGGLDTLETLIETDKIINFDDYAEYLPHVLGDEVYNEWITPNLDVIRENYSAGTGGLYILPHSVGTNSGLYAQTGTFDRNTPKLKWDVYEAIGAPEVTDMWSLIDIVEQMLKYQPTLEDGTKMFGTFLDNGLDTSYWGSMELWMTWHGGDYRTPQYMAEVNYATEEISYIFEDDSVYKEGLKWYNELYKRGLMDPDSISTSRADQAPKLDNGLAMLPAGTLPGWATKYYEVFPEDCTLYRSFVTKTLSSPKNCIVIFKDSENIETCLAYLNMLSIPMEAFKFAYGPEDCMWELEGNTVSITDEFAAWLEEHGNVNFFPMPDGTEYSIFNAAGLISTGVPLNGVVDINGDPVPNVITSWPDAQAITNNNDNWNAWKKTMGAEDLWDYTKKHDITVLQEHPWEGVALPTGDDNQKLAMATLKDVIVPASWNCVYAETEEEFEQIWDQMVKDAEGLGAQDIYDWFVSEYVPNK